MNVWVVIRGMGNQPGVLIGVYSSHYLAHRAAMRDDWDNCGYTIYTEELDKNGES